MLASTFNVRSAGVRIGLTALALPVLVYLGNPAIALITAAVFSLALDRPLVDGAGKIGRLSLQTAIVLLGFRMDVGGMAELSADFAVVVGGYVIVTLLLGLGIGHLVGNESVSSKLVSAGTAICGGTAIASLSPVIRASSEQTGIALAMVFLLNVVALLIFPSIGEWLALTQREFGLWVSMAIHDTSSVVATAAIYGEEAAEVATTLKLGRTLWLIPLLLVFAVVEREPQAKLRIPLFVLLFVIASSAGTLLSLPTAVDAGLAWLSRSLLVLALFCIGTEITRATLGALRGRVLWQGLVLWACVVPVTLGLSVWLA